MAALTSPEPLWSAAPLDEAAISIAGNWENVSGLTVHVELSAETTVMCSYSIQATASGMADPGGSFLTHTAQNGLAVDVLGARLTVDGVPYRASGSHVSPLAALERSARQLRGYIFLRLSAGKHNAAVQWKKWGTRVASWRNAPGHLDGYASGRSLSCVAHFDEAAFVQPLAPTRITTSGSWQNIPGLQLQFPVEKDKEFVFSFLLHVRPESAPGADGE